MLRNAVFASALWFASTATASVAKQCPTSDICFSLNVPDATVSAGKGDIYIQIASPTNYSYVSIAQGMQMSGAHFLVVYTSGDGKNITVSPRLTTGHGMPTFDPATEVTLLEGSGVENGIMTANIKCSNCNSWNGGSMDLAAQSTAWIWAHATGATMNTDDVSAPIHKHDDHGTLSFDATAHGGNDTNPFVSQSTTTAPHVSPSNQSHPGGHSSAFHGPPKKVVHMYTAHAILACLAWAAIFPIGGIMIRLLSFPGLVWVHASLQIFGYCLYIAAVGLGIQLSINPHYYRMANKHVIIGLTIFGLFFLQSFTGYLHHFFFKRVMSRTTFSYVHLWTGRLCITLGMINAGFGFEITHKGLETWEVKTYTVCAVIVWVVYVVSSVVGELRRKRKSAATQRQLVNSNISSGTDSGAHTPPMSETVMPNKEEALVHSENKDTIT